jgi:Zn-dependent protease
MELGRHIARDRDRALVWRCWLPFGRNRSVELSLHLGFVLTLLLVTWVLGQAVFPRCFPGWAPMSYWLVAVVVALTDSLAGLAHELGHAAVATARGRRVYQITLYGLAAAVRRSGGPTRPRDQLLIAMAGPLSHLLIAAALWGAWQVLPMDNEPLKVAAGFPAASNLALGVINLLPLSPLDGGRAARALIAGIFRV